jgi:GNAT superfamily N-acetyltransferase
MTVDTDIRRAGPTDTEALGWLQQMARDAAVDQRGGPAWLAETPAEDDWAWAVSRSDRAVFVGTVDGVVLGMLDLALGEQIAMVQLAYVHPEARELGLGDTMIEHAIDAARAAGCRAFEGVALPGDRETKNLYERAGITARKIILSTRLDG